LKVVKAAAIAFYILGIWISLTWFDGLILGYSLSWALVYFSGPWENVLILWQYCTLYSNASNYK